MVGKIYKATHKFNSKSRTAFLRVYLFFRHIYNSIVINFLPARLGLISKINDHPFSKLNAEFDKLYALVDHEYCLLDLPHHHNIGDQYIHEGNLQFLSTLPYQKRYEASLYSFDANNINKDDIIILHGGGNLGDLYPTHQQFREHIVAQFSGNKIIIFPQTIYFQKTENLRTAVECFSNHADLTLCARDQLSYKIACRHFKENTILLVPDMATCKKINLVKIPGRQIKNVLLIRRKDKEINHSYTLPGINNLEISDWPTFEYSFYNALPSKHKQHRFYLNEGITFLSKYDLVISTRLHGSILALLLGIPTILVDNSYSKNRTYYQTWLKDIPGCYFARSEDELKKLINIHFPSILK